MTKQETTMEGRFVELTKYWDIASSVRPLLLDFIRSETERVREEERKKMGQMVLITKTMDREFKERCKEIERLCDLI